jgi:D-methionine transport system ATP-binding protein
MTVVIEIVSASKRYENSGHSSHAFKDISLMIEKGDVFGIIGLSGAGKSTLIRAIARLVPLTSGKIFIQGQDIALMGKTDIRNFRKSIGMVFQHFNLLSSRTVAENISYPLEITHLPVSDRNFRVDELLDLVGLKGKRSSYPSQLSGGEKQRVGIARALATHPKILLCDEATSALDPKSTREILELLKKINREMGITIVLITHEMDVVKHICNKVGVLEQGRIVEHGSVAQIFSDPQHEITKQFLQKSIHELPSEFFKESTPNRKLLRLRLKGSVASEPIMALLVRKFDVDANILLGWIDRLQNIMVGTLIVEVTGTHENITSALSYLRERSVHYEVIENEL